ncbi:MAG TPA: UDP-N-acetylmuramoyl-L-alanyl-D-glutamate--2,6-diaminopimelate ligase [Candidatus Limnocylindrales bacterium]
MPGNFRPASVAPISLSRVEALLGLPAGSNVQVTGVTHASDKVQPGDIYAALPGSRRHGAEFAHAAVAAGAVAILTDRAISSDVPVLLVDDPREVLGGVADLVYGQPSRKLTILGITGTAGKTSTAYMIESGLRAAGHVTGLLGTVETRLGDLSVSSVRTTPEATDLHALFAVAVEAGVTAVVMEVSSHALAMGRVGGVAFDVAGWTNFGADHLDFHASTEDYFAAKAKLFDGRALVEVLNFDDLSLRTLIKPGTVTYSAAGSAEATWYATDASEDGFGQRFRAHGPMGALPAAVALPGRHNVANALLALAMLTSIGVRPEVASAGVAACPGVPGRLERVETTGEVIGVVDYAHKTDAIVAALAALRELAQARDGRVIAVIGAGGDRDKGKRPQMGAAAAEGSDLVIVTDDNPRTEDPAQIRQAVIEGASGKGTEVVEVAGRREAIAEAARRARPGDVVAVLGKGHETGQEVGTETHPFDDRVELAAALKDHGEVSLGGSAAAAGRRDSSLWRRG